MNIGYLFAQITNYQINSGPDFQDWKCEEDDPSLQSWYMQDGLSYIGNKTCILNNLTWITILFQINGQPVFNLNHDDCVREIKCSGQTLRLECER